MKLPRYTATTPPPRISGLARTQNIGALVRTSDIAKWQAVGTLGQALSFAGGLAFRASQNRRALDDEIEGGIFTQKAQEIFNLADKEAAAYDFTNNMPQVGDEDYYTTVENYNTDIRDKVTADTIGGTTKNLQKLIGSIKSPRVREKAKIWLSKNIEQKSDVIRHTYAAGHENWQITQMTKLMQDAAENGHQDVADYFADKMDEYNLATPQRAEILKKNNKIIADTSITTQMAQAIMAQTGYQDAIEFVVAQDIDVAVRGRVLSNLATQERIRSTKHQQAREQTMSTMLADVWDGRLTDPQVVTNALRLGYLDDTDAKYLREAMLNPDPPKLNLQSLATVKQAIEEIGTNTKTVQQALSTLYANLDSIDPITGKSLVNEIFSEQDKNKSEMKRESRALMEELIRDRDKFTGMFTDDERQILASAEAYLMLDSEIQKAVEAKKPLERRDIMIKAIQIGRQMKKKVKQEEADKVPPGFEPETEGYPTVPRAPDFTAEGKPVFKGALTILDFVLTSKDEPEKVFDSEGREIGLRRKGGAIFRIGYHAIFDGKKYEYTGNGNWKLVE